MEIEGKEKQKISIARLKRNFAKQYPDSIITPYLENLSDEISTGEIVGVVFVLLEMLDAESHNNLNNHNKKEVTE